MKKNDVQFGYSWWRIEQDAIIASFGESDQRAPTNIVQNRIYALWKLQKNVHRAIHDVVWTHAEHEPGE